MGKDLCPVVGPPTGRFSARTGSPGAECADVLKPDTEPQTNRRSHHSANCGGFHDKAWKNAARASPRFPQRGVQAACQSRIGCVVGG